jgi:formylglycine-generating enzyme required for sulfatase activity
MKHSVWFLLLLLTMALFAVAVACGSSGGGNSSAGAATNDDDNDDNDDDNDVSPTDDDDNDSTITPGFAYVAHGTFTMGSPPDELGRFSNETQHQVTLTHDFEISVDDTVQSQFATLMGWNPSNFTGCGGDCPVEKINWWDALAYADQLTLAKGQTPCYVLASVVCTDGANAGADYMACENAKHGGISSANWGLQGVTSVYDCTGYRLPTEAEWEYAIRAGTTTAFYSGPITQLYCSPRDPNLDPIAWYCGNDGTTTMAVGQKLPNAWGLYDMSGNVWQWIWDWYGPYSGNVVDPEGPASGKSRVLRGGGWSDGAEFCRSAMRGYDDIPGTRGNNLGFRLVRSLP